MNRKISWSIAAALGVISPAALALGLGGASVESYLGQSLEVRVDVISETAEELESITAGLASADDFELLGLSRSAITVPLEFELVTDAARPYIQITSDLKVTEPVLQVLVEVVWANGRMLREYTLFLDPPTFDSAAPPVAVKPAPKPAPKPATVTRPAPAVVEQDIQEPEAQELDAPEPASTDAVTRENEPSTETGMPEQAEEQFSGDDVYGPVAKGETLWGIASKYSKDSGYTVHQAMHALRRKNPEAFINDNINSLMRGAILRMPTSAEMAQLTSRDALLESMQQEQEALVAARPPATEYSTPTVADTRDHQEPVVETEPELVSEENLGHLEIIPPADETGVEQTAEPSTVQADSTEAIQEELSRTEEELLNARQENTYLSQRIQELESELETQSESTIAVEDTALASIESNLAAERAADKPEPSVAITPGGEEQAWYAGKTGLIAGIAVVLIALIVWALRRRSAGRDELEQEEPELTQTPGAEDSGQSPDMGGEEVETVVPLVPEKGWESEPETEVEPEWSPEPESEPELEIEPETEPGPELEIEPEWSPEPVPEFSSDEEQDDDTGDLEIDDPETKLDLARAYLSLGDKEASKSMLEEVLKNGNEVQKEEARQMLDEF